MEYGKGVKSLFQPARSKITVHGGRLVNCIIKKALIFVRGNSIILKKTRFDKKIK